MKTLTKYLIFTIVSVAAVCTGCKKNSAQKSIVGVWTKTFFQGKNQYIFNKNLSFEYDAIETDSVTKAVLGYRYKLVGTYTYANSTLTLNGIQSYSGPNDGYGQPNQLIPSTSKPMVEIYTAQITNAGNTLSLYFTCPPNADCVPSPIVYSR